MALLLKSKLNTILCKKRNKNIIVSYCSQKGKRCETITKDFTNFINSFLVYNDVLLLDKSTVADYGFLLPLLTSSTQKD